MEYDSRGWLVIGHDWAVEQLTLALNRGRMRHAYLISGPPSIGKTTLARSVAMALNCTAESGRPCGVCRACTMIAENRHPDISIVEAEQVGGTLKIDQIRDLQHMLALRPYEARFRVAIIRRFQEAHPAAANALLKTLEEPPRNVVLILTADDTTYLLATIKSRCQTLPLHPLQIGQVEQALIQRGDLSPQEANLLARLSGGRMGWAVSAIHDAHILEQRREQIAQLEALLSQPRRERFSAAEQIAKNKDTLLDTLHLWLSFWRDTILVANKNHGWLSNVDRIDYLRLLADYQTPEALQKAAQATQRTINYIPRNVNARLAIEAMLLDYPFMPAPD